MTFMDQRYAGEVASEAIRSGGLALHVITRKEAKRGYVLLPRRWIVGRSLGWAENCSRPVKDEDHYGGTLAGIYPIG